MQGLLYVDWYELFVPKFSVLEILLRGILVYLAICLLLRVILKRQAGKVALSDLLVLTIVGGVCRNPLIANAYSLTDCLGVVIVILGCSYALDWLSYHVPFIHQLLHPSPVLLIRDGAILHENLRKELMTENQLRCKLRGRGIIDPAEVAEARMEGDGEVSVVKKAR